jgi:glycosyltransferase involved in cell wall biosynthesis
MLISVVIPVRNAEATLPEALESVFLQGVSPLEVVVVDGASTDHTAAIARSFAGVRVIEQPGTGLADARNAGLAASRGDLIAFLDADDLFTTGRLAVMRDHLLREPSCAAVLGHMVRRDCGGAPAQYAGEWLADPVPALTPGGMLARASTFARVGAFDTALTIACDTDWLARLEDCGLGVAFLPQVVLVKRVRQANLSRDIETLRRELLLVARRRRARARSARPRQEP